MLGATVVAGGRASSSMNYKGTEARVKDDLPTISLLKTTASQCSSAKEKKNQERRFLKDVGFIICSSY